MKNELLITSCGVTDYRLIKSIKMIDNICIVSPMSINCTIELKLTSISDFSKYLNEDQDKTLNKDLLINDLLIAFSQIKTVKI